MNDIDAIGPLLHGVARAWRLKLDERLKPMGLSQAKWRTLLRLSMSPGALTQAEIASHLGIEEPTLVTLLHRLEDDRWVARKSASHDRRCKTVHLTRRAQRVIEEINSEAFKLRHELLDDITPADIYGIEVYRGPATVPRELLSLDASTSCGLVMIWTR